MKIKYNLVTNPFKFEHNPHYTLANTNAISALRVTRHVLYISEDRLVSVTKPKHSTVSEAKVVYCDNHTEKFRESTSTRQAMYV
jgi:hypothetical protein